MPTSDDEAPGVSLTDRIREAYWPSTPPRDPEDLVPADERRAAMRSLDSLEAKMSAGALLLAILLGITIPTVFSLDHKVSHRGKSTVAVAPDAWLLCGAIVVFAVVGLVAVWRRKRTLVTFSLALVGLALTPFISLVGFAFIFLGIWFFLRAWRLGKYGTVSGKVVGRQASERRAERKAGGAPAARSKPGAGSRSGTKAASASGERKPPAPSKRYTPKSAPKKRVAKPAE